MGSSARFCHVRTSSLTASVTWEISPALTSAVDFLQVPLDFARGHAARVQRHDLVVEAREPRLMFGQDLRLERADAVSRHFDLQFSKVPLYRLATGPVARIPAIVAHGIVLLVPQMMCVFRAMAITVPTGWRSLFGGSRNGDRHRRNRFVKPSS